MSTAIIVALITALVTLVSMTTNLIYNHYLSSRKRAIDQKAGELDLFERQIDQLKEYNADLSQELIKVKAQVDFLRAENSNLHAVLIQAAYNTPLPQQIVTTTTTTHEGPTAL